MECKSKRKSEWANNNRETGSRTTIKQEREGMKKRLYHTNNKYTYEQRKKIRCVLSSSSDDVNKHECQWWWWCWCWTETNKQTKRHFSHHWGQTLKIPLIWIYWKEEEEDETKKKHNTSKTSTTNKKRNEKVIIIAIKWNALAIFSSRRVQDSKKR